MNTLQFNKKKFEIVQTLISVFKGNYKTVDRAVSTEVLLYDLKAKGLATISAETLRELIKYIRDNNLMKPGYIVSSVNKGYWLSTDKSEISDFLNHMKGSENVSQTALF